MMPGTSAARTSTSSENSLHPCTFRALTLNLKFCAELLPSYSRYVVYVEVVE
jgi:hypothetical protein